MIQTALSHLECARCGARYDPDVEQHLCSCGGPLLARYDVERARATLTREAIANRPSDLWRFGELLPVREARNIVSLGERPTPNIRLTKTGRSLGIDALIVKDESLLPTGSFKARGAAAGVSRARELGTRDVALPTNGYAGVAWAAYCARGGMYAHIAIPRAAPSDHREKCGALGAEVEVVDGTIADAGRVVASWVAERGYYDAATLREPYRIEGKKTMGFEIAESFGWALPDVIVYPTGGGVGLIGMHKAFAELLQLGLIRAQQPRFVVVQSAGCAPLVQAWEKHQSESTAWRDPHTIAYGINVPKALGDFIALKILYDSDGAAIAVEDAELQRFQREIAREEGLLLCLEGAAAIAAIQMLRQKEWLHDDDRVLAINTGASIHQL